MMESPIRTQAQRQPGRRRCGLCRGRGSDDCSPTSAGPC